MRYCTVCGNPMPETAGFCFACGAPAAASQEQLAYEEEKEFLDNTHRLLRYERLVWKILGVVWLVLSLIIAGNGLLFVIVGIGTSSVTENGPDIVFVMLGFIYFMVGLLYLPIAIVNLKTVKKVDWYMDTLHTDVRPTATRNASVGMIVFSAIFNTVAMIFYIINFARTKSCQTVIDRIIFRQQTGG